MKRLLILLCLFAQVASAQIVTGTFGSTNTATQIKGVTVTDKGIQMPVDMVFTPTLHWVIRLDTVNTLLQVWDGASWINISGGTGGGGGSGPTNLTIGTRTTTTFPVQNSNGTGFTIPTFGTNAGLVPGTSATGKILSDGGWITNLAPTALQKTSNLSDLNSITTARTNLGLGSLATASSVGITQLPSPIQDLLYKGQYFYNSGSGDSVMISISDSVIAFRTFSLTDFDVSADVFSINAGLKSTWNGKQDALVSGVNIHTINGNSLLGPGDMTIAGGGSWSDHGFITLNNKLVLPVIDSTNSFGYHTAPIAAFDRATLFNGMIPVLDTSDASYPLKFRGRRIAEFDIPTFHNWYASVYDSVTQHFEGWEAMVYKLTFPATNDFMIDSIGTDSKSYIVNRTSAQVAALLPTPDLTAVLTAGSTSAHSMQITNSITANNFIVNSSGVDYAILQALTLGGNNMGALYLKDSATTNQPLIYAATHTAATRYRLIPDAGASSTLATREWVVGQGYGTGSSSPDWSVITSKPNSGNFIYNQNTSAQSSANAWIDGTIKAAQFLANNGDASTAGLGFKDNPAMGMYRTGSGDHIAFTVGDAQKVLQFGTDGLILGETSSGAPLASNFFRTTNASGTNLSGSSFIFQAGISTGTAVGGAIKFQVSPSIQSSGTTANTLVDAFIISGNSTLYGKNLDDATGVAKMVTVTNGIFGYQAIPSGGSGYTDEQAQDAIGAMVSSEFTYTDATPLLAINAIAATKITTDATHRFTTDANLTNFQNAYDNQIVSLAFSGTTTKTLTLTQQDGGTVSGTFSDLSGSGGLADAYISMTDGSNTSTASGGSTFKYRTANNLMSLVVTDNDATHGDNILFTINQANLVLSESQITSLTTDLAAKQDQLNGTGFVKTSGTTVSYDNSTYLTTAVTSAIGTTDQVNVSSATGAVTFSLPQSIATTSSVHFETLLLDALANSPAANYALAVRQTANNRPTIIAQRQTETSPTGDFLSFYNAASTPAKLFNVDITGNITAGGYQGTAIADAYISSSTNWSSGYNNQITTLAVTGTTTKTITLNQQDGGTVTGTFTDISGGSGTIATTTSVLKGDNAGNAVAATAGTDYVTPSSTETLTNKTISDANNTIGGTLLNVQFITTTGAGTYTPTTGTKKAIIVLIGAGGGGGGVTGTASSVGVGGGGAAGDVTIKYITGVTGTYAINVGVAGTAGANTGGTGGTGGTTDFTNTVGPITYSANGGFGGVGQTAGTTAALALGGNGQGGANGNLSGKGAPGGVAYRVSGTFGFSGYGGSGLHGGGGNARTTAGAGNNGGGFGGGGGGAMSTSAAAAGGTGSQGAIIIYEYR